MNIVIIGGGPAGLRAAEITALAGAKVTLFDAKPSVGRKFLVAGRGGLNLTKVEPSERFYTRYSEPVELWHELIADFDSDALRQWAAGLGVETFVASTGRVYPKELKAAPLLRRWVERLRKNGVRFQMNHRWVGLKQRDEGFEVDFNISPKSPTEGEALRTSYPADAVILALGGGSWPETGSDGGWVATLEALGIQVSPLQSANCGWQAAWSTEVLAAAEGQPLKNLEVSVPAGSNPGGSDAGRIRVSGELMITCYGLEGGALYQLGPALRGMSEPEIRIDFKPTFTIPQLIEKLGAYIPSGSGDIQKQSRLLAEAKIRWRLSDAAAAILASRGPFASPEILAGVAKDCPVPLIAPQPIAEAISSAGGIPWRELTPQLMICQIPGLFAAGEMLDWEAPTGGYLIQGCFATGTRAAHGALSWLAGRAC